ncbi:MAG: DUF2380 domain-containing protein [Candidatus Marinimicrobia bacterium]|nr:DUF2380 domain-containing protein [Candidatus Neomarinimicrobiota bacterium]
MNLRLTARRLTYWPAVLLTLALQTTTLPAQAIPIAILDFDGFGISQTEAIALTNRLRNELFRLGRFEVVDRGMMENILSEQDFQQTGCTSNDCLVEVGRLLGARQMVGGSISKVGGTFTVSARLVDVETGKVLSVSDFDLRGELDDLLTRGMAQVAARLSPAKGDMELPQAITAKVLVSQPASEVRQPTAGQARMVARPSSAARPRFQVGIGFSVNYKASGTIWGSWFPMDGIPWGKLMLLPVVSGGLLYLESFSDLDPYYWEHTALYALVGAQLRRQGQHLGYGLVAGVGFGFGEEYEEYDGYNGEFYEYYENYYDTGGLVLSLGGQLTLKLGPIHLLTQADLFVDDASAAILFHFGLQR